MSTLTLPGRILYLTRSAELLRRQILADALSHEGPSHRTAGALTLADITTLADDVSTDEITPVPILTHFDDQLGRFTYTGFEAISAESVRERPFAPGLARSGGFAVVVAGRRYGKGSSREHSPAAEKLAGIKLVIASSFERIYRQNADNIGLFTSTDLSLVARIERDEAISVDELVADRDPLAAAILRAGGLLAFGQTALTAADTTLITVHNDAAPTPTAAPQTLFEKIIARHVLPTKATGTALTPGAGLFVRADLRFIHEYYTGMCAHMLHSTFGKPLQLVDPASIVVFEDHTSYVQESPAHLRGGLVSNVMAMCRAQREFVADYRLRCHRTLTEDEARADDGRHVAGISHAMVAEHDALPGQVVVGTDSHTPHSGALGCVAFGVGTTDMANAFVTGAVRMTLPPSLRVQLDGELPAGVSAKDIVLHLLALPEIRQGAGVGKVFEFTGDVVKHLSTDERATLTNMTAELGGFTGLVAPDEETQRFIKARRGVDVELADWMHSDPGAHYDQHIRVDCSQLSPMVARPGDPGRGLALSDLCPLDQRVTVDIAYGGSCTAGKLEDFEQYAQVFDWALQHGLKVPEQVQLFLQFGTTAVRDACIQRGYLRIFEQVGARMLQPSCGACSNCGPGSSTHADQVTVSAINRNFPGRSGPGQVWLASPATVAASAVAGKLMSFAELQGQASHPGLA